MANLNLAPTNLTQTINPWTWWIGQLGFININETNAGDSSTEQEILQDVASYGRQLGWISDALEVVLDHTKPSKLKPDEAAKLKAFGDMLKAIDDVKARHHGTRRRQAERLVQAVEALKQTDRTLFDEIAPRLRQVIR